MTDLHSEAALGSRSAQLDRAIRELLAQTPELEAAAVVSFDGLPMAAALPASMDEDRVAAMSAALLSLGERAAEGLGRGELSQVYIEGDNGTVFLVSADDEAVLVAVASKGAKAGMMMYEVRRAAAVVATVLRAEEASEHPAAVEPAPAPHLAPADTAVGPHPGSAGQRRHLPTGLPACARAGGVRPAHVRPAHVRHQGAGPCLTSGVRPPGYDAPRDESRRTWCRTTRSRSTSSPSSRPAVESRRCLPRRSTRRAASERTTPAQYEPATRAVTASREPHPCTASPRTASPTHSPHVQRPVYTEPAPACSGR
jgi:predicted regulator of Ras-like GTPase activity (Roadblock/LC7/MglB family)